MHFFSRFSNLNSQLNSKYVWLKTGESKSWQDVEGLASNRHIYLQTTLVLVSDSPINKRSKTAIIWRSVSNGNTRYLELRLSSWCLSSPPWWRWGPRWRWGPDLRPRLGAPTWGPDLGPRLEAPIWGPEYITTYIYIYIYIYTPMHNVIKRPHYCIIKHIHFFINVLNLLHDNYEHKQFTQSVSILSC